ncbi:MAG: hypothetical protein HZY76_02270 [Anaerolineae bacterium]|nr:MAG: hypothetical protein HZY76_02270 [Anaerolineae bacterium]
MSQEPLIRASDIGQYLFCHRAWWLARIQQVPSSNLAEMAAGSAAHTRHGRQMKSAQRLQQIGVGLMIVAALLGLLLLWMLIRGSVA